MNNSFESVEKEERKSILWNRYSIYTMYTGIIALILIGFITMISTITDVITDVVDPKTIGYLAIISGSIFIIGMISLIIWAIAEYIKSIL